METADILVIGAGIVGMATACELQQRHPQAKILLLDKEDGVASHQSGRNSGVIHAGVYYAPGSLKARFCREGLRDTKAFCDEHKLPYQNSGKLIVATDEQELARMEALYERSLQNEIEISKVSEAELRQLEPNINGVGALMSPSTGITSYAAITEKMAELFRQRGGEIRLGIRVRGGKEDDAGVTVTTDKGDISAGRVVCCAGLMSDRLVRAFGAIPSYKIIPFRGEYFRINNQPDDLVSHLIYPVPDPERPFLGVHLTRKLDGGFTVGPNAVLAFKREGYKKTDFSVKDMFETLSFKGFWQVVLKNAGSATEELAASVSSGLYVRKVQKYCSRITKQDLTPYPPGIRAQAVSNQGELIDDFLFMETRHTLHVCNAPSPAATASMPIARYIADQLETLGKMG